MDALMDIEKRLGVSDAELSEFEAKTSHVAELIRGLRDGKLRPEDVRVPGELTEEEAREAAEREERAKAARLQQAREARDKERREWWERAELLSGRNREDALRERLSTARAIEKGQELRKSQAKRLGADDEAPLEITDDDGQVLFPKPKAKADALDYSVWDTWTPDDPVSLAEMQRAKEAIEEERNAAFEQANPDFCRQFKEDQEAREKAREAKEGDAEKLRLRGNRHFRRKELAEALRCYSDALKSVPWSTPVLCNLAQVHLRQAASEDALEFSERALFLDPENVKALWRHAKACVLAGRLEEAVLDLTYAAAIEPDNADVAAELAATRQELFESRAENLVQDKLEKQQLGPGPAPAKPPTKPPAAQEVAAQPAGRVNNKKNKAASAARRASKQQDADRAQAAADKIAEVLRDPLSDLSVPERMCAEVCKPVAPGAGPSAEQALALDGLAHLVRSCTDEEEEAQLLVLLRRSGALRALAELAIDGVGGHAPRQLVAASVKSKRCLEQLREARVLERAMERCAASRGSLALLGAIAETDARLCAEIATPAVLAAALKCMQQAVADDADDAEAADFQRGALLVSSLAAVPAARAQVEAHLAATNVAEGLGLLACLGKALRGSRPEHREDAGAALANLCQSGSLRAMADAAPVVDACLRPKSRPTANTPAGRGYMLAALVNMSIDAGHASRAALAEPEVADALFALALGGGGGGGAEELASTRASACALLSRVCTDAQQPHFIPQLLQRQPEALAQLCGLLPSRLDADDNHALTEHVVRCVAALLRHKQGRASTEVCAVLVSKLEQLAALAAAGKMDFVRGQSGVNLCQCFVSLSGDSGFCERLEARLRVVPALVKLLQLSEDGPVRKNVAVGLAKLARSSPENMAAVRALRGMEMLIELGGRLA